MVAWIGLDSKGREIVGSSQGYKHFVFVSRTVRRVEYYYFGPNLLSEESCGRRGAAARRAQGGDSAAILERRQKLSQCEVPDSVVLGFSLRAQVPFAGAFS